MEGRQRGEFNGDVEDAERQPSRRNLRKLPAGARAKGERPAVHRERNRVRVVILQQRCDFGILSTNRLNFKRVQRLPKQSEEFDLDLAWAFGGVQTQSLNGPFGGQSYVVIVPQIILDEMEMFAVRL